jgi:RND family efflux transporter MFP subunit
VTVDHPVTRELIDEDEFNGWMQPSQTVEVRARVRGHIQKIHFQDGDLVKSDQLLFELDPRPFQVEVDQAAAQADAFKAQKEAAEKDVARYTELVKTGGASRQQLEKAQADAAAYDAQINAKLEEVKGQKLNLEFSKVTAPIDGRISRAQLTEGNLVNAGGSDPLLTTIVAMHPMHVYFNVDERALYRYRKAHSGSQDSRSTVLRDLKIPFKFALETDEGFPNSGLLDFGENRIDPGTGTIQLRGEVNNEKGTFLPGSRVRVRVPISSTYKATVVPDSAILSDQDKKYLLVVDDKNVVLRRNVTPAKLLDDGMRVILAAGKEGSEVKPDDRIIVEGLQRARINYPVDPVKR